MPQTALNHKQIQVLQKHHCLTAVHSPVKDILDQTYVSLDLQKADEVRKVLTEEVQVFAQVICLSQKPAA